MKKSNLLFFAILITSFTFCTKNSNDLEPENLFQIENKLNLISKSEASDLQNNFLNKTVSKDVLKISFKITNLKNYINLIEEKSNTTNPDIVFFIGSKNGNQTVFVNAIENNSFISNLDFLTSDRFGSKEVEEKTNFKKKSLDIYESEILKENLISNSKSIELQSNFLLEPTSKNIIDISWKLDTFKNYLNYIETKIETKEISNVSLCVNFGKYSNNSNNTLFFSVVNDKDDFQYKNIASFNRGHAGMPPHLVN